MKSTAVIIVAGGGGSRMGGTIPKQFRILGNSPMLAHTINNFATTLPGAEIVVVLPKEHMDYWKNLSTRFDIAPHHIASGGSERFHSVRNGIEALTREAELIAVQDGVRPLGSAELILRTIQTAAQYGAAIPVTEATDSFRETDNSGSRIIDRKRLRIVQTPQIFRAEWLRTAYQAEYDPIFTDDASVVERAGHPITLCEGERQNIKITTPEDLLFATAIFENRETEDGEHL